MGIDDPSYSPYADCASCTQHNSNGQCYYSCSCGGCPEVCQTCYDQCPDGCAEYYPTYDCNCQQCDNYDYDASVCGCNEYYSPSGWTDDPNCRASTTNTLQTSCRTVYY
jgi:hypothetical protein